MIWGTMAVVIFHYMLWAVFPFSYAFVRSFTEWNPLKFDFNFIGLDNYKEALFDDTLFWPAMGKTAYFTLANVVLGTAISLFLALLVNSVKRFQSFFRFAYFLPVPLGIVSVAIVFQFILQTRFGILNHIIFAVGRALGFASPPEIGWLTRPQWAMPSIILLTWWKWIGYRMVIFLAGLQGIPEMFYEAAQIDGAGWWARFRHITLPLLTPTALLTLVHSTISSIQVFAQVQVMTGGGPMNATRTIMMHMYDRTFGLYRFGYGAALSFIMFIIILVLTVFELKVLRTRWQY
jgi:multiple sugar transport system permease protein